MKIICTLVVIALIVFAACNRVTADVEASDIGAGGLVARNEHNVSIENERLTIEGFPRDTKILVEYDFLNHSNQDITTVVAFPIPDYDLGTVNDHMNPGFEDFRVWVDGVEVNYDTDCRAILDGHDYTNMLNTMGIDICTLAYFYKCKDGGFDCTMKGEDFQIPKLSEEDRKTLRAYGLIRDDDYPEWLVRKRYYWPQTFPAGKIVRMRHEYRPKIGVTKIFHPDKENLNPYPKSREWNLVSACVPPEIRRKFNQHVSSNRDNLIIAEWVQYILTSANTWKKPIKNFELVLNLDIPANWLRQNRFFISFCWDGPVKKTDRNTYKAIKKDFVPDRDLTVYFFARGSRD